MDECPFSCITKLKKKAKKSKKAKKKKNPGTFKYE
jgi:hypothetical protein